MSRRNHLHNEMRWRAVGMLHADARQTAVARHPNVLRSAIRRLWNHYQRDQNASRRCGSGRRRITTTADDRYLLQCARCRRTLTAKQLASQLSAAVGRPISCQTVSRRLHEGGLFARRLVVCVSLSPAHVRARCIGPVNIAVGHQSSGATYSLRMSLDLTSRTIPEGQ
ncbi:hypothetical protein AVEN_143315-1 [Araneus ventricosus]|uniref:Transposase Tc1-like domain-containing protein n=1 Tax=Araneus ventricosus TaxID=182803 RepID=A0A4Y2AEG3_ARAVE|nr:hypothetical protein AVEN_143315-1 [Araneus ventricosus]